MSITAPPSVDRHGTAATIDSSVADLREAITLIQSALNTLTAARESRDAAVPPVPRVRHAMPSVGPRRPARHGADDW